MPQFPFYSYPKVYIFSILPNISRIICSYLASLNSIQSPRASLVTWISGRFTFPSSLQSYSENLLSLEKKVMIYGYIRVSSDKQTVENQRFEITNFCKKEKLIINGWIEETIWNHSDKFTGPEEWTNVPVPMTHFKSPIDLRRFMWYCIPSIVILLNCFCTSFTVA